ncbi:hypothetical protein CAPN007_18520 [Capnocytophaga canimorsus]|nr:hypothetical protein CAPN007_18520 [Capnocytophaga canimorsus]
MVNPISRKSNVSHLISIILRGNLSIFVKKIAVMFEYKGYMMPKNKFPFWDKLIIGADFVTYKRYKVIGVDEKRIPIRAINGVTIKEKFFFRLLLSTLWVIVL